MPELNCVLYRLDNTLYFHVMDEQGNISQKYISNKIFYKQAKDMSLYFGELKVTDTDGEIIDIYIFMSDEEIENFKFSFRKNKELKIKDKNLFNLNIDKFQKIIWSLFDRELLKDVDIIDKKE